MNLFLENLSADSLIFLESNCFIVDNPGMKDDTLLMTDARTDVLITVLGIIEEEGIQVAVFG